MPEPACFLNHLVDSFEAGEKLLVVVTADLVAVDEVSVQVVQLHVTFTHVLPVGEWCKIQT